ncbi:MAG: HIT domain-containing protein [Nanoarchaeota archaeon]|nr:HIT domain-containing protein [Nanoarchaeota archaeon]
MTEEQKCLFCEIVKGNIPSLKIYENEGVVAVLNIKPATKGHVILIPKQHHTFIQTIPEDILFQLMVAAKAITAILTQILQCPGINIIHSMGSTAGQKIGHASFEIIPRYAGDNVKVEIPEGKTNEQELYEHQKIIVKAFQESTIKLLKAIKSGEIKVSPEIKTQAEKALAAMEEQKAPKNPLKEENVKRVKLEDELGKL